MVERHPTSQQKVSQVQCATCNMQDVQAVGCGAAALLRPPGCCPARAACPTRASTCCCLEAVGCQAAPRSQQPRHCCNCSENDVEALLLGCTLALAAAGRIAAASAGCRFGGPHTGLDGGRIPLAVSQQPYLASSKVTAQRKSRAWHFRCGSASGCEPEASRSSRAAPAGTSAASWHQGA